ncbi:MAG: hypothetical protein Tsb0016_16850 [Sphingomonadales bacterium]
MSKHGGNKGGSQFRDADATVWRAAIRDVAPLRKRAQPKPLPRTLAPAPRQHPPLPMPDFTGHGGPAGGLNQGLDRQWQQRLRRGQLTPERSLDLHGLGREPAYGHLMRFIGQALAAECRVLLVITGKGRPGAPGLLRQLLPDWLAASPYASAIMAVRPAHPSHGGAGALYVILRRRR